MGSAICLLGWVLSTEMFPRSRGQYDIMLQQAVHGETWDAVTSPHAFMLYPHLNAFELLEVGQVTGAHSVWRHSGSSTAELETFNGLSILTTSPPCPRRSIYSEDLNQIQPETVCP